MHALPECTASIAEAPLAEPPLADKVAALLRPDSYPEPVRAVQAIETQMSWANNCFFASTWYKFWA